MFIITRSTKTYILVSFIACIAQFADVPKKLMNVYIVIHLTVLLEGNYWKFQLLGAIIDTLHACMHMYINRARQHVLPIATKVVIATLICTYTSLYACIFAYRYIGSAKYRLPIWQNFQYRQSVFFDISTDIQALANCLMHCLVVTIFTVLIITLQVLLLFC